MNKTQLSLEPKWLRKKERVVRRCVNSFFKVDWVCFSSFQFQVVLFFLQVGLENF